MAVNQRRTLDDIQKRIQQFPGPYIGYVKNPTDLNRMGRLFVFIPSLHGTYDTKGNKSEDTQLIGVSYCSPFAGQTPLRDTNAGNREFSNTQKSYGFWMIPPDIDTKVLVMFADGDINSGYWMGCVFEDFMNQMTPGIGASQPGKFVGTSAELERYAELGVDQIPVAEAQRRAESQSIDRANSKPDDDAAFRYRPVHTPSADTLIAQGLITDPVRGTTTSSARRETPSQVFGISTPGPIDFTGQTASKREAINRHGKIYNNANDEFAFDKVAHSRLGGNTFVMDDGTPVKREGSVNKTEIENELIRLRTRSGAQLLLHNTEELVYITNTKGTAWIEFTKDGKIDIYAQDSVSIHTEQDMNFKARRDINLEAGRNVNIKAIGEPQGTTIVKGWKVDVTSGRIHMDAADTVEMKATSDIKLQSGAEFKLYATTNGKIEVGTNLDIYAGVDFLANTGNEIHMNTDGKVSQGHVGDTNVVSLRTWDNKGVDFWDPDAITKSIMKRVPTTEPYTEHENKRYDETAYDKTDRELPDTRGIK